MASTSPPAPTAPRAEAATATAVAPNITSEEEFVGKAAMVLTPIALGAMFLPPRKLDLRMMTLGGIAVWGVLEFKYVRTGQTLAQRWGYVGSGAGDKGGGKSEPGFLEKFMPGDLPDSAKQAQAQLRYEKWRRELVAQGRSEDDIRRLEALRRDKDKDKGQRGTLESIWMGDAEDDWKAKRAQKEREALQEGGEGYWGLIVGQISEVMFGGKKDDDSKQDECKQDDSKRDDNPKKPT